jgi:fucose 4-O-acetylase-like acetyltransferase
MASDSAFSNTITHVKGFAILLVVLGHIDSPLGAAVFSFHIPLFFCLGGIFIKSSYPAADFLKKNFIRLIVPYLIFGVMGWLVNDIKNVLLHRPSEDLFQSITGLLFWMDMPHLKHYGFVLWFLPALFWARILCFWLIKFPKINEWLMFMLCALCAYVFSNLVSITLPFGLDKGLVALPWVFMGFIFYRHKENFLAWNVWKVAAAAMLVFLICIFDNMPHLDMATKNVGYIFITLPYTFAVIFLIVHFAHKASLTKFSLLKKYSALMSLFGIQSVLVYIIHPYTNNIAYLLSTYVLGEGYWYVKFALTVLMLIAVIQLKLRFPDTPLFKYL